MSNQLAGKYVLITGGAQGIGLHTAREFAEAGCHLILTDINADKLEAAANELETHNVQVFRFVVDVADRDQVENLAKEVIAKCGRIDILINNAGVGMHKELEFTNLEEWQKLLAVNFWGPLYHIYAFLPYMKQQGSGQIVNVSSGQAFFRVPTWGAYAAIKLAIGAVSEIMHYEVRKYGIKVTTVYPYMVNTGFYNDVESHSWGSRLMLRFLPYYSQKPETVGKTIYNAVRKGKRVEMVNVLNYIGKYINVLTPISNFVSSTASFLLSRGSDRWKGLPALRWLAETVDALGTQLQSMTGTVGFRMDETMSGEHEFVESDGKTDKAPMEFTVTWGTDNLFEWLNPFSEQFMLNTLEGTISIDGLCEDAPCTGTLALRYFDEQKIRYTLDFEVDGVEYCYIGEKRNIYPWNLHVSHTTCYGEVREKESDKLVSKSITYFRLNTVPSFLSSFQLVRADH